MLVARVLGLENASSPFHDGNQTLWAASTTTAYCMPDGRPPHRSTRPIRGCRYLSPYDPATLPPILTERSPSLVLICRISLCARCAITGTEDHTYPGHDTTTITQY
eukprot:2095937-Rhodomonas_salina.2